MWMLVRADSDASRVDEAAGVTTLAASPDTADRGDPWRWSVRLLRSGEAAPATPTVADGAERQLLDGPDGVRVEVLSDPAHVRASARLHSGGKAVDLAREAGSQLVVVPLQGEALVSDSTGPWRRWLSPGDVFVVEGEEHESLRLTPAPEPSHVAVLRLSPCGNDALRWVP
ncbi:MAG TPA: hypothetical protein VFX41_01525 [Actinomycetales bacterium]|jgi:hypothetical protein|nr:hypothetical protein [Actinomycetales bacterium]